MTIMFNDGTNMHASGQRTVSTNMLAENTAHMAQMIATITVTDTDGTTSLTPTLDATSRNLGFAYNATNGAITYTGTFDFEALTDGDTNTAGKQHIITLTATGSDGTAATHEVVVTLTDVDEKPAPSVPLPKTPIAVIKGEAWSYTIPDFTDPEGVAIASYAATIPSGIQSWLTFNASTRTFTIAEGATSAIMAGEHEISVTAMAGTQASEAQTFTIALSDLFNTEPQPPLPPVSIATITRDIGGASPKTGVDIFHIRTIQRGPDGEGVTVSFVNDTTITAKATGEIEFDVMGSAVIARYNASLTGADAPTIADFLRDAAADARTSGLVAFNKGADVADDLALRDITGLETTGYESGGGSETTEIYEFTPGMAATLTANGLIFTAEVPGTGANGIIIEYETPQNIQAGEVDIQYQQGVLTIRYNSGDLPTLQTIIDGIAADESSAVLTAKLAASGTGGDELVTTGTLGGALGTILLAANGLYFIAKTPGAAWDGAKIVYETTSSVASGEVMVKGFDDANNIVTLQINNTPANYPTLAAIIAAIEEHSVSDVLAVRLQDFGPGDSKLTGTPLGGTFTIGGTAVTPGMDATLQSEPRNVETTFDPGPDAVHLAVQNMEAAQATITNDTQDILTVTATQPGALGNDITITMIENNALDDGVVDFYIDGRAITAVYAPGADTAPKTTVGEFIAAAEANAEVSALVTFARASAAISDLTPMVGTATNNLAGAGIVAGEHASVTVGGLVFTAKNPGIVGNALRVVTADSRYSTSPGAVDVASQNPLPEGGLVGLRYDDGLLTISLPNKSSEYPTLDNIIAKVNSGASTGVEAALEVALADGANGSDRVTPFGYTPLTGGVNAAVQLSGGGLPPAEATKATLTYNGLIFTAKEAGEDGNDIVISGSVNSNVPDNQVVVSFNDTTNVLSLEIDSEREKYPTLQTIITAITAADVPVSVELLVEGTGEEKLARSFYQRNDDNNGHRLSGGGDAPSDSDAFADPRVPLGNIGTAGVNTLTALDGGNREVVVDGQGGNDTITLGDSTEEVVYRLTDGMDTVNNFTIGTDRLTLIAPPGAFGEVEVPHPDGRVAFTVRTKEQTNAFNGLLVSVVVDNSVTQGKAVVAYTAPSGGAKGSLIWRFNDETFKATRHFADGPREVDQEGAIYGEIGSSLRANFNARSVFAVSPGVGTGTSLEPTENPIPIAGGAPQYDDIDALLAHDNFGEASLVYNATDSNYTGIVLGFSDGNVLTINFATALDQAALIEALGSTITDSTTLAAIFEDGVPTSSKNAALSDAGKALVDTLLGGNEHIMLSGAPPEYEIRPEALALTYDNAGALAEAGTNLETYGYLYPSAGITNPTITHNGADALYGKFSYDAEANRWAYTLVADDPQTAALAANATETITFTIVDAVGVERTHDLAIPITVTGSPEWLSGTDTQFRERAPDAVPFVEIQGVRFSLIDHEAGDPTGVQINTNGSSKTAFIGGTTVFLPPTRLTIAGDLYVMNFKRGRGDVTPQEVVDLWNNFGADGNSVAQGQRAERLAAIRAELITEFEPGAMLRPMDPVTMLPEPVKTETARFPGHVPLQASVEVHNVRFTITEQGTTGRGRKIKFEAKTEANQQGVFFDGNNIFTVIFDPADTEYANITPRELVRFVNAVAEPNANITIRASLVNKGESSPGTPAAALTPMDLATGGTASDGVHTFLVPDPRPNPAEVMTGSVTLNHHSPNETDLNQHILRTNGRLTITDTDGIASVTHDGAMARYGTFSFDVATGLWAYTLNSADSDLATVDQGMIMETITFTVVDKTTPQAVTKTHELNIEINIIGTPKGGLTDDTLFQERQSDGSEHFTFSPLAVIHSVLFEYDTTGGRTPPDGFHFVIEAVAGDDAKVGTVVEDSGGGFYTLYVDETDTSFTPQELADLWNISTGGTGADGMPQDAATRTGRINATVLDDTLAGVDLTTQAAQDALAKQHDFAPRPHNIVTINLEDGTKTSANLTTSGLLTIADVDGFRTITMGIEGSTPVSITPGTDTDVTLTTQYGTFTFNHATAEWSYTANKAHGDIPDPDAISPDEHRNFLIDTITFTVTDGGGTIETYDLRVGIDIDAQGIPLAPDDFPESFTATETEAMDFTLPEFRHIDGDTLMYEVVLADDNGAVSTNPLPAWLSFNGTTRVLSVTADTDDAQVGEHDLIFRVTDEEGPGSGGGGQGEAATLQPFKLIIANKNEAPTSADTTIMPVTDVDPPATPAPATATEGQPAVVIPASAFTFTDPDADTTPDGQFGGVVIVGTPTHVQFFVEEEGGTEKEISAGGAVTAAELAAGRFKFRVTPSAPEGPAEVTFKFKVRDAIGLESDDEYTGTINIVGVDTPVILHTTAASISFISGEDFTLTTTHLSLSDPDAPQGDTTPAVFTLTAITGGQILVNDTAISVNGTFTQAQVEGGMVKLRGTGTTGSFSVTGARGGDTFDVPKTITFNTDSTLFESDANNADRRAVFSYEDSNDHVLERSGTLTITDRNGITASNVTHNGADAKYGVFTFDQDANNPNEYDWTYTINPTDPVILGLTDRNNADTITITVTDDSGNPAETFDLELNVRIEGTRPEAPEFAESAVSMNLPEDHDIAMPVYIAVAEDDNEDDGDTITYSLKPGGDADEFNINPSTGEVRYKASAPPLDYETPPLLYIFTVVATDSTGLMAEQSVTLNLTNVDDPATAISLANEAAKLSATQLTTSRTKLADIVIEEDADGNSPGMFEVVATNADHAALFTVMGTELFLKANAPIGGFVGETITVTIQQTGPGVNADNALTLPYSVTIVAETNALTEFMPGSEGSGPHNVAFDHDDPADPTTAQTMGTLTITDTDGITPANVTASDATYGTFTLTAPSSGNAYSWTYTFDSEDQDSLTLGTDITVTETITITVIDDNGFQARDTLTFSIDISGTLPPRPPTTTPAKDLAIDEDGTYTFKVDDFGYDDANDDDELFHITIMTLPGAHEGVLKLNGVKVSAGDMITADELNRTRPTDADPSDPDPTGLVFEPANRAASFQASFTYTVSDGAASDGGLTSAPATMNIVVTADDDPPVLDVRRNIAVEINSEPHIFSSRQLGFNDPDFVWAGPLDARFTLTEITGGVVERYNSRTNEWITVTSPDGTFTHEDVTNGHVRLDAFGSGTLTVTVTPQGGVVSAPQTIAFTAQLEADVDGTNLGGAGGQNGEVDLSGQTTARTITTGLGDTTIKPGGGDDKVDPGLGDDEVDLGAGGDDVVLYRFERDDAGNIVGWDGGDTITGFTPGEDRLVLLDIGAGNTGGTNTPFIDNIRTGFIVTLATAYTGSGDRARLNSYDVEGIEIHFAEAVLLPGGVLGGSVVTILFDDPIAWDDFNTIWLAGNAGNAAFWPNILQFRDTDAGKTALRGILGLNEVEADRDASPSGAGTRSNDTLSTVGAVGQASVYGREGDDTITLGRAAEEVIYRLGESGGAIANMDGSDIVNGFTLGVDELTFVGGGVTDLAGVLSGIDSVALAYSGGEYTAIVFTIVAGTTLRINFASSLDAAALMARLSLDDDGLDAFFASGTAPTITGSTEATADIASGTAGHDKLTDLFGGNTLTFANSVPAFKAAELPSSATRSVAVGGDGADTIDLNAESGHWVIFGGMGDDTITLAAPTSTQQVDEIVYRLAYTAETEGNPATTTTPDGTDIVNNFALGEDKLTFIADGATLADVLGAFAGVSLIRGAQNYTGIAFETSGDDPATPATEPSTTLTLNFTSGTGLTNDDLRELLGLADADAAVGALFVDAQGTPLTAAPTAAGTHALSDTGIAAIADLFRIDNIEVDDALPAELL